MILVVVINGRCGLCIKNPSKCKWIVRKLQGMNIPIVDWMTYLKNPGNVDIIASLNNAFGKGWLYFPALIKDKDTVIMGAVNIMRELKKFINQS